jgi:hypothetical protein
MQLHEKIARESFTEPRRPNRRELAPLSLEELERRAGER